MKFNTYLLYLCILSTPSTAEDVKRPKYFIAIKKNEGNVLTTLETYTPLLPPRNKFYADPMLFKHKKINYVFFEDYDYQKGIISYITIDENASISKVNKALELSTHLSFPHIFQDGDEIYMTPETYNHKSVSLFKAKSFPDNWEHQRILIWGQHFVDPILFKYDGYYWLFTAVKKDRLCIYYAETLNSTFRPHPINLHSIRGRNAGSIYYLNGRLIRPTMDCKEEYGKSMILKEIIVLNPREFIEQDIGYIQPNWAPFLDGTHSYSQNEDYVVYDGQRNILPQEDFLFSLD